MVKTFGKKTMKKGRGGKKGKKGEKGEKGEKGKLNNKSKKVVEEKTGFRKAKCGASKDDNSYTCYTAESLKHLRDNWNKRHPDHKILTDNSKEIWEELKRNMANTCNTEACWMRQQFMKKGLNSELLNYTFAPSAPKSWITNPNTWLSSTDLSKVMKQYERKHDTFDFIGPSPIDYDAVDSYGDRVWEELYSFDPMKQIKKGKRKVGIIFNTDEHTKGGAHWISLFVNLDDGNMYFFDSVGDKAPSNVMKFCNTLKQNAKGLDGFPEFTFHETHPHSHQKKDTECGIYSLFFIAKMLEKQDYDYFKSKTIGDKDMEKFRQYFFNKPGTY